MKKLVLTAILITGLFSAQAQVVTNGLVDKYSFNNGSTNDEVGSNHLVVYGNTKPAVDRFGRADNAMYFDGSSNLHTSTACFYPGQPYSICFWYKISDLNKIKQNFFNTDPHTQLDIGFNWFSGQAFHIGRSSDGNNWGICYNTFNNLDTFFVPGSTSGNWNYFVITYDSTKWMSYNNGTLVDTCSGGASSNIISQMIFGSIMAGVYTDFMIGYLDDIRIYNRAININEVNSLFTEGGTSVANNKQLNNSVDIFPNPTVNKINCRFDNALKNAQITIINSIGSVVQSKNNIYGKQAVIDVEALPTGLYMLQIREEGKILVEKFAKQ